MASPQIDVDEIVATLEQIRQRGHSAHTVFRDWVNLMMFALQDRDDPYLEIVDDYRERGDMDYPDGSARRTRRRMATLAGLKDRFESGIRR